MQVTGDADADGANVRGCGLLTLRVMMTVVLLALGGRMLETVVVIGGARCRMQGGGCRESRTAGWTLQR